jgi:hypothetical protein
VIEVIILWRTNSEFRDVYNTMDVCMIWMYYECQLIKSIASIIVQKGI